MTKFEEELFNKVPCKFELTTEAEYKKSTLINHFKNWHSDDEYQELLDKYSNLNDNYEKEVIRSSKLESQLISREKQVIELREADKAQGKEIIQLKSQLQQQALPVVPECVGEWYEGCAPIPVETCITDFLFNYQKEKSVDDGTEFEQWFIRTDNSIEILMDMKRLGYTVEKPQLFYLKNKLTTSYLILDTSTGYFEHWSSTEATGRYKSEFTQQEIESMQTGSYRNY